MNARNRAIRRAGFDAGVLAIEVLLRVFMDRDARETALLRAPVHETIFTNVKITAACAALPVVGQATAEIALERVIALEVEKSCVRAGRELVVNGPLPRPK